MKPGICNLEGRRGDTFEAVITVRDAEGVPFDFSNTLITAQVRGPGDDAFPLADFTVDTVLAGQGVLGLSLTPAETVKLRPGLRWDLQVISGTNVRTYLAGTADFTLDVTR